MTRVHGKLFSDERDGLLVVKPSQPFFGVTRDELHFDVTDGAIDLNLDPTPPGIHYLVAFKQRGDIRRTDFTLKWRIPDRSEFDVTPGSANNSRPAESNVESASVFERVQLRRAASELGDALDKQSQLEASLVAALAKIRTLETQFRELQNTSEAALVSRDRTIARLSEANAPSVQTIYVDRPVPPELLNERLKRLEAENIRLSELNQEYYKSVVQLHQLQLDKARITPQILPVDQGGSTKQRLLRKLIGN